MPQELGNTNYYTMEEVAQVLNKAYETVRRRIDEGLIDADQVGRSHMISQKALVDHLVNYEALPESTIDYRLNDKPIKP